MRELLVVLQREFVERVKSKSFILSTLLTPLILLLFAVGPILFSRAATADPLRVVLVDETPNALGPRIQAALRTTDGQGDDGMVVTLETRPLPQLRDSLQLLLTARSIDAYVHLGPDLLEGGAVQAVTRNVLNAAERRRISGAVSMAVQTDRLQQTGLSSAELAGILRPVQLNTVRLTVEGEREHSDVGLVIAFLMAFLLYMLIMLYGMQVMQSVQEEKTNRIAEVLVSSIRAPYLMLGKVLGVGSVALLQITIWIVFGAALFSQAGRLEGFGFPADALGPVLASVGPATLLTLLAYMLGGFFLYATLFAAVGAAAETNEDAQRFTFPLIMPLILPIMLAERIITAPGEAVAIALSWFPLTTPLVMPMRMTAGGAGGAEAVAMIGYLFLCIAAFGWVAGKIYRVGILRTGQRAGWSDLVRWIRMA